jgi:hypothetical protein
MSLVLGADEVSSPIVAVDELAWERVDRSPGEIERGFPIEMTVVPPAPTAEPPPLVHADERRPGRAVRVTVGRVAVGIWNSYREDGLTSLEPGPTASAIPRGHISA